MRLRFLHHSYEVGVQRIFVLLSEPFCHVSHVTRVMLDLEASLLTFWSRKLPILRMSVTQLQGEILVRAFLDCALFVEQMKQAHILFLVNEV